MKKVNYGDDPIPIIRADLAKPSDDTQLQETIIKSMLRENPDLRSRIRALLCGRFRGGP